MLTVLSIQLYNMSCLSFVRFNEMENYNYIRIVRPVLILICQVVSFYFLETYEYSILLGYLVGGFLTVFTFRFISSTLESIDVGFNKIAHDIDAVLFNLKEKRQIFTINILK